MSDHVRSAALSGDINAIASLVGEAVKLTVEPEMQHGLILVLKVKSLNPNICPTMIRVIEEIKPNIYSIKILGTNWNKFFVLKEGKYVENTASVTGCSLAILLAIGLIIALVNLLYKPPAPAVTSAAPVSSHEGQFLGLSSTGHPMYLDGTCVSVKGVTVSDIQKNTSIDNFKNLIRQQTGKQCVLLD